MNLGATAQDVVEPEARAAFIWILGEYGQSIQVGAAPKQPCRMATY